MFFGSQMCLGTKRSRRSAKFRPGDESFAILTIRNVSTDSTSGSSTLGVRSRDDLGVDDQVIAALNPSLDERMAFEQATPAFFMIERIAHRLTVGAKRR